MPQINETSWIFMIFSMSIFMMYLLVFLNFTKTHNNFNTKIKKFLKEMVKLI